jgi:DNA-binding PadR family transcriptional regulator
MLTELEGDVLGFVWKLGPVTTYRVRKIFADSPASHWRAGAGSIYPVVNRLLRAGLVRAETVPRGSRLASRLTITPKGRRSLARWIAPKDPEEMVSYTQDPVRTRVHFLALVPVLQRRRFLTEVEALLEEQVTLYEGMKSRIADSGDPWDDVVRRGALEIQKARLRWIRWILESGPGAE